MDYEAILNELSRLDPKREKNADNYHKVEESRQELLQTAPWRQDPKYFENVQISSLALVRMTMHARAGGTNEVMGVMTGKIQDRTFIVMDAYPLPVEATETRVNAMGEAYEYMVQYLDSLDKVGRSESLVGWYHSHPAYGCWLSRIDVDTQKQNQQFQDPFLAIVIDPNASVANGEVEIGAFRTYPEGSNAEGDSDERQVKAKAIGEYGLYAKDYYPLKVSYFRTSLDEPLFDLVWSKYWSSLLAENRLTVERELNLQKTKNIVDSILDRASPFLQGRIAPIPDVSDESTANSPHGPMSVMPSNLRLHSQLQLEDFVDEISARSQADAGALIALKIRNAVFGGGNLSSQTPHEPQRPLAIVDSKQSDTEMEQETEPHQDSSPDDASSDEQYGSSD